MEKTRKNAGIDFDRNVQVLFLDKNHPLNAIDKSVSLVEENLPKS